MAVNSEQAALKNGARLSLCNENSDRVAIELRRCVFEKWAVQWIINHPPQGRGQNFDILTKLNAVSTLIYKKLTNNLFIPRQKRELKKKNIHGILKSKPGRVRKGPRIIQNKNRNLWRTMITENLKAHDKKKLMKNVELADHFTCLLYSIL